MTDQSGLSPMGQWIVWVMISVMCLAGGYMAGWTDGGVHEQKRAFRAGAAHYYLDSNNQPQFEYLKGDRP
jgi:hypothetical protein